MKTAQRFRESTDYICYGENPLCAGEYGGVSEGETTAMGQTGQEDNRTGHEIDRIVQENGALTRTGS